MANRYFLFLYAFLLTLFPANDSHSQDTIKEQAKYIAVDYDNSYYLEAEAEKRRLSREIAETKKVQAETKRLLKKANKVEVDTIYIRVSGDDTIIPKKKNFFQRIFKK